MLNRVEIQGTIGFFKSGTTKNGGSWFSFSLTNLKPTLKEGKARKIFVNVSMFDENKQDLKDGDLVEVIGELDTNEYTSKTGQAVKTLKVIATKVTLMQKKENQPEEETPTNKSDDDVVW